MPKQLNPDDVIKKLNSYYTRKELTTFKKRKELMTGISEIDADFSFPRGYYVIIGNPGTGKSWFAIWLSRVFYKHHLMSSVYFSLEMTRQVMIARILQQWSDLTKAQFESGSDTSQALDLLEKDVLLIDNFYEEDTKGQTPENFEMWIDEYHSMGYRIFHFDHLHELDGANDNSRNQKVTEQWAKLFQKICKKYDDIWLFVYAQPNGEAAKKKVLRRTDIAGSKAITQKCDFVLSLNRNIEIDDNGIPSVNENQREIILWLDKTRYTERPYIPFFLKFRETGNFGKEAQ